MGVAIIHVVDEEAHTSKEYRCDIRLLLAHMKLLAADLQDVPGHDTEITVKSDIPTFDWLMAYVKAETRGCQPEIGLSNSIQLLLASHYLKMSPVLKSSVIFIAQHLLELAPTAAGQLCSLQTCLIEKVAQVVQEEVLEALFQTCSQEQHAQHSSTHTASTYAENQQRSSSSCASTTTTNSSSSSCMAGMLVEKLYKHKLRALLQQQSTTLLRCRTCGQLFASASRHTLQCPAANTPANRPRRLPLHDPDPSWGLQSFLTEQRSAAKAQHRCSSASDTQLPHPASGAPYQHAGSGCQHLDPGQHALLPQQDLKQDMHQGPYEQSQQQQQQQQQAMTWRELFWLAWGHAVVLYCQRCCSHFPARLLHECRYHPLPTMFESDVTAGRYPCCGAPAWHPGAGPPTSPAAAAAGGTDGTGQGPCCSRDHDAYLAVPCSSSNSAGNSTSGSPSCAQTPAAAAAGSRSGRRGPKGAAGVEARRALQLCRLYGPLITAAVPAVTQQQQQEGGGGQAGLDAGGACTGLRRPPSQQQQQQHTLPLLVRMVNGSASSAAAAAAAPAGRQASPSAAAAAPAGGRAGSSSTVRSVSPLPPIASPREQRAHTQVRARSPLGSSRPQQDNDRQQQADSMQQQGYSLPSPASVHAGSTQIGRDIRPSDPEDMCGNRSRSCSRSSSSRGSSRRSQGDYDIMYVDGDSFDHRSHSSTQQEALLPSPGDANSQHSGRSNSSSNDSDGDESGSLRGTQSSRSSSRCSNRRAQQPQQQQMEPMDVAGLAQAHAVASAGSDSDAACSDVEAEDLDDIDDLRLLSAHATPLSSVLGAVRAAADARTRGGGLGSSSSTGPGGSSAAGRLMGSQVGAPLADTFSAGGRRALTDAGRKARPSSQADRSRPSTAASMLSLTQQRQRAGQQQQEAASRPVTSSSSRGGGGGVVASAGAGLTEDGGMSSIGAAYNRTLLLELVQQDDAYRMAVLMRKLDSMRLQPPPSCAAGSPHKQQLSQVDVMHAVNGVLFAGRASAV